MQSEVVDERPDLVSDGTDRVVAALPHHISVLDPRNNFHRFRSVTLFGSRVESRNLEEFLKVNILSRFLSSLLNKYDCKDYNINPFSTVDAYKRQL